MLIDDILRYSNKIVEGIAGDEDSIKEEVEPSKEVGLCAEPTKEVQSRRFFHSQKKIKPCIVIPRLPVLI